MATWPSIVAPAYGTGWRLYKPAVNTESEGGYIQSRPRSTKGVYFMPLHWEAMPHADLLLLQAFFEENQGDAFDFPNPLSGATESSAFMTDEIIAVPVNKNNDGFVYRVDCPIRKI